MFRISSITAARVVSRVLAVSLVAAPFAAAAASLQVTPLLIEIPAGSATSSLTLRNDGARPVDAQVRVFRWTQRDGADVLEPTETVVASPPMASLRPRADYLVRIIRPGRQPVSGEEAYRLVVDELPGAQTGGGGSVAMVLRHSVPVFFTPPNAEPLLRWNAQLRDGRLILRLDNEGARRVRVSRLVVSDGSTSLSFGDGLVGYGLAGSSMTWSRPIRPGAFRASEVRITAVGDIGPLNAVAKIQSR